MFAYITIALGQFHSFETILVSLRLKSFFVRNDDIQIIIKVFFVCFFFIYNFL